MNNLTKLPRRLVRKLISSLLERLSTGQLHSLLTEVMTQRARALEPADGLRFLFNLDAALYPIKGQLAIAYGEGVHTKHRHLRYHDFFVNRVYAGERVLDIGCGNGALAYDVAEKAGAQVVGIDFSASNIDQARQRHAHPRIEYYIGDALKDLPQEEFNVVILSNVLEHLPNRPDFLHKVQFTMHPSRILIRVPLFERDWQTPLKRELGVEWRLDVTHETEYTLESFAAEIAEAKLKIVHQEVRWSEIWAEVICHSV